MSFSQGNQEKNKISKVFQRETMRIMWKSGQVEKCFQCLGCPKTAKTIRNHGMGGTAKSSRAGSLPEFTLSLDTFRESLLKQELEMCL